MNKYGINQVPDTCTPTAAQVWGRGLTCSVGAILLVAQLVGTDHQSKEQYFVKPRAYDVKQTAKTFGQHTNIISGEYEYHSYPDFEKNIASFYTKLLNAQEPLGQEFASVLEDNLWDLMIKT